MKYTITFFLLLIGFSVFSQKKKEVIEEELILIENDSIIFDLDAVNLLGKLKFNNKKERRYYRWYTKKVHNAYPFAVITASTLDEVDKNLKKFKSKRKRKKYIRKAQKLLNEEFKGKLKNLTRTEGKLLIRLIHRQTGTTSFNLIKKYRSGWKAFWYNNTAKLFKLSLKKEYNPKEKALDYLVEDILQRAFLKGSLIENKSKLSFDFQELSTKYKDIDIIKVIDAR